LFRLEIPVEDKQVIIRNYTREDIPQLIDVQRECFPPPFPEELWWSPEQLMAHIETFPQGALCAQVGDVICGSMTGLLVNFDPEDSTHDWASTTDNGYIWGTHKPDGDTLYIVDISVRPSFRKLGIGRHLMQSMYYLVVHLGLSRLLGGGRMPGYCRYADSLTAEIYVQKVLAGELTDPVITFLLRCGRKPVKLVANYLEDEESKNYALLMEWPNPFRSR